MDPKASSPRPWAKEALLFAELPMARRPSLMRRAFLLISSAALGAWVVYQSGPLHSDVLNGTFGNSALSSDRHQDESVSTRDFQWSNIEPSRSLQYTPCFGSFQCARLSVPLNWNASLVEQELGPRAAVAVIRLPAKVPVTDPRYGGPVLLNPGGPGESGVYETLLGGQYMQNIVDSPLPPDVLDVENPNSKYFDVMSFDPRGVNNTTPRLHCFPDAFNQQAWSLRHLDFGLLWSSESIIGYELSRAAALGASCSRDDTDGEILRYVNTAQVAGDMAAIVERHGEWRAAEASRLVKVENADHTADPQSTEEAIIERTQYLPGQEKLQYWGNSYGTLLGSTFAALHPNKVGRVVLDGVVDPADHYSGGWLTQLLDLDKIITRFSKYCFEAGPEKCPLYTGYSSADIEARFTSIMLSLKKSPIPVSVIPSSDHKIGPEMVTYGDVHLNMLSSMYFTFASTETFWKNLVAFESRNVSAPGILNIVAEKQAVLSPDDCTTPYSCIPYNSMLGPNQAIGCKDLGGSANTLNLTHESFTEYIQVLETQSRCISPNWARNKMVCQGFAVPTAWLPALAFEKQQWANTSHPLLIIGNSHDPVTPLRNARRVATLFPGSVVLHQDSEGHCSGSNPSLCKARVARAYFQTGALPAEGTICQPEIKPFVGCIREGGCDFAEGSEDKMLWNSMLELADPFGTKD
jgi:pimeloyl-ACP methyl ester carboxylesterase